MRIPLIPTEVACGKWTLTHPLQIRHCTLRSPTDTQCQIDLLPLKAWPLLVSLGWTRQCHSITCH